MHSDIRRIIAVDAHRRRTGRCPTSIVSLGTGEAYEIDPTPDGFVDIHSGMAVRVDEAGIMLPERNATIAVAATSDVGFAGFEPLSNERFTGRSGGGATVTIYDAKDVDFFQYAVSTTPIQS